MMVRLLIKILSNLFYFLSVDKLIPILQYSVALAHIKRIEARTSQEVNYVPQGGGGQG
jgi:hypothetical protein